MKVVTEALNVMRSVSNCFVMVYESIFGVLDIS